MSAAYLASQINNGRRSLEAAKRDIDKSPDKWLDQVRNVLSSCRKISRAIRVHFETYEVNSDTIVGRAISELGYIQDNLRVTILGHKSLVASQLQQELFRDVEKVVSKHIPKVRDRLSKYRKLLVAYKHLSYEEPGVLNRLGNDLDTVDRARENLRSSLISMDETLASILDSWSNAHT
jgi:hypothetical protein